MYVFDLCAAQRLTGAYVKVDYISTPSYDSGWVRVNAQERQESHVRLVHELSVMPAEVRVLVRATEGPQAGMVFEARGDAHRRDSTGGAYGGVVFGYSARYIDIWSPALSGSGTSAGYTIWVPPCFGRGTGSTASFVGDVRAQAWTVWGGTRAADFTTAFKAAEFVTGGSAVYDLAYSLPFGALPELVQVTVSPMQGGFIAYNFLASGMLQSPNAGGSSGIMYAYNASVVRVWGVSPDPASSGFPSTNTLPLQVYDGWGGEAASYTSQSAQVTVRLWAQLEGANTDTGSLAVDVTDVMEPPRAADVQVKQNEYVVSNGDTVKSGALVSQLVGTDDDAGDVARLVFSIASGNDLGAFKLSSAGTLTINNTAALDYEARKVIFVGVAVTDGVFVSYFTVNVTIVNQNDPCSVVGNSFSVDENSPKNQLVGIPLVAYDQDVEQTLAFSIVGGNIGDVFKITPCAGQLRVATEVLNFELISLYNLTIRVEDNGVPLTFSTVVVPIRVSNRNDRPNINFTIFDVPENSPAGFIVGPLPVFDEDNDTIAWQFPGDRDHYFRIVTMGLQTLPYGTTTVRHSNYFLSLARAGLNYEDPLRPRLLFKLNILGVDSSSGNVDSLGPGGRVAYCRSPPLMALGSLCVFTVRITDTNDAPIFLPQTRFVLQHSPTGTILGDPLESSDEDSQSLVDGRAGRVDTAKFALAPRGAQLLTPFNVTSVGVVFVVLYGGFTDVDPVEKHPVYSFIVRCTDSGGDQSAFAPLYADANVTVITVNVNDPPVVEPAAFSVRETAPVGTILGFVRAQDPDVGDTFVVSITGGDPYGFFTVLDNGNVTVASEGLDSGIQPVYRLVVSALDASGLNGSAVVVVTLISTNKAPVFTACPPLALRPTDFMVSAGYSAVQGLVFSSTQPSTTQVFNLGAVDGGPSYRACELLCAAKRTCAAYTYFTSAYKLKSFARSCWGRSALYTNFVVVAVGSTTVVTGIRTSVCETVKIPENNVLTSRAPVGQQVGFLLTLADREHDAFGVSLDTAGNVGGAFRIDAMGNITIAAAALNFEGVQKYMLVVRVIDWGMPNATGTALVVIHVMNVNEPPRTSSTSCFIAYGDPVGTRVCTAWSRLTQDDDTLSGQVLNYSVSAYTPFAGNATINSLSYFVMDPISGQTTLARQNDMQPPFVFNITVKVCGIPWCNVCVRCVCCAGERP